MEVIRPPQAPQHTRRGGGGAAGMTPRDRKAHLAVTGVLMAGGARLAASPLVAGYMRLQLASWHNALAGLAIVVLALLAHSSPPRRAPVGLLPVVVAVWLLMAPWLLGYGSVLLRNSEPGQATWNGRFVAAVVLAGRAVRAFLVRRSSSEAASTANAERR